VDSSRVREWRISRDHAFQHSVEPQGRVEHATCLSSVGDIERSDRSEHSTASAGMGREQEPVSKTDVSFMKLSWWGRGSRNPSTTARFRVANLKQTPYWICE